MTSSLSPGRDIRLDVGDEAVLVLLLTRLSTDELMTLSVSSAALEPHVIFAGAAAAQDVLPAIHPAPSTSARNRASAAQISGNRSATAGMAQLCSISVPLGRPAPCTSAM